jgi:acyl transferase domain-containing protein
MGSPRLNAPLQALSPVGRCQSFDAAADGYGRGEGFAAIVLTQSGSASSAGDVALAGSIRAHIRGSAVNQDGRSSSLTAPNGPSQQALLGTALAAGLLLPSAVGIVAVHGTGEQVWMQLCCVAVWTAC